MLPITSAELTSIATCAKHEILRRAVPGMGACIFASRLLQAAFNDAGIEACPVSVELLAFNAAYMRKRKELGRNARSKDEVALWNRESGAYSVGIGFGDPNPLEWSGHLVITVAQTIFDLTLDHASRPQHDIELPPWLVSPIIQKGFLDGKRVLELDLPNGGLIAYKVRAGDTSFMITPDWLRSVSQDGSGARIASRIRQGLLCSKNAQPEEMLGHPIIGKSFAPRSIGRNDQCPCGSGKKWKRCCGSI